jgi:Bifunctional DNA primase/polymerase, N-terminal/Primase C terminal 1 (PriCT-1)
MKNQNPGGESGAGVKSNDVNQSNPPGTPASSDPLAWALYYATHNVRVFPCKWWPGRGSKAPLVPPPGYHLATTDQQQVVEWWVKWPQALIGSPVTDNRIAIDIDPQHGGSVQRLEEAIGEPLNPTLTAWSGRGTGGCHLMYKRPAGDLTQTKIKKLGCDIRVGGKGYTILPPSLHPATGRPYWWEWRPINTMNAPLYELIRWDKPIAEWPSLPTEARLLGILKTMAKALPGTRNDTLFWCGCRLAEAHYPQSAWDALAQVAATTGLPNSEIQGTTQSAIRRTVGESK